MKKILVILSLIMSFCALAQEDSTNKKFSSNYSLLGIITGGNSDKKLITNSDMWSYTYNKMVFTTNLNMSYGTVSGKRKETEYYQTISIQNYLSKKTKLMVFSDIEHSNLRNLDIKYNIGAGFLYRILKKEKISIDVSEAMLMEKMVMKNDSFNIFSTRLSTRIRVFSLISGMKISLTSFIQPAVGQMMLNVGQKIPIRNNFNARTIANIDFPLKNGFSFSVNYTYIMETYVKYVDKTKISPYDYIFQIGVKYKTK